MTIIAYDGKYLAVDRAATAGSLIHHVKKSWIVKTADNMLLTGFGPAAGVLFLKSWYIDTYHNNLKREAGFYPSELEPAHLVVLNPATGMLTVRDKEGWVCLETNNKVAFGEGADFAYGAMAAGASSIAAARIACPHRS